MTAKRAGRRALQATFFLAPLVLFAWLSWQARAVVDDAYINFRIIANVLDGHGPVYNVGERVESGTSPAWLAVLTVLCLLTGGSTARLPWLSVVGGIAFGTLGLAFAQATALRLWSAVRDRDARWPRVLVPAGSVVVLAVPPFREFVACGLETGLVLGWIGAASWALASRSSSGGGREWRALLVGLGPLVRPELALLAGPMIVALAAEAPRRLAVWGRVIAWAAAVPVTVQIVRMGYYAALVPNTALAKEAFGSYWTRGLTYLVDFVTPYWLVVPLLPVLVMVTRLGLGLTPRPQRLSVLALLAGAALDVLYVVRLGGDFMHARMLLPALFALVAPAALWPIRPRRRGAAFSLAAQSTVLVLLAAWGVWCGTSLRVAYAGETDSSGLADEVNFYRRLAGHPNPVDPDDYRAFGAYQVGQDLRALAARGERWLVLDAERWPLVPWVPATIVTDGVMIGLAGYLAGPAVHIADTVGLTDPIASRLRLDERGRTGHEKSRPRDWLVGRYTPMGASRAADKYQGAADARRALACGRLAALGAGVTQPLTAQQFASNVWNAPALTRLRIPSDPGRAATEACGRSGGG